VRAKIRKNEERYFCGAGFTRNICKKVRGLINPPLFYVTIGASV
jgi:hypothetical protein